MQCPQCGSRRFEVELTLNGFVQCEAGDEGALEIVDDVQLESQWSDDAECRCSRCIWEGTLDEVRGRPGRGLSADRSGDAAVQTGVAMQNRIRSAADVRQLLARYACPEPWRKCLELLLEKGAQDEQMIEVLKLANLRERESNPGDTSLL